MTFKAISDVWFPFITNIIETENGNAELNGLYAELWSELSDRMNFTTIVTKLPLNITSGRWSHMIESVKNHKHDLVLTGCSQTFNRYPLIDFSFPLQMSTLRYTLQKKEV